MLLRGQIYNCVHFAGVLEVLEISELKNEMKVKFIENDGRTTQDKIDLQKFIWAIDRGDYVNQRILSKKELWYLDRIKQALSESFGLSNALNCCDTLRIGIAVQTLQQKTGYQHRFIYSILDTIREL